MRIAGKIVFVLLALALFGAAQSAHANIQLPNITVQGVASYLQGNPTLLMNPKDMPLVTQNCSPYPGFINKIVKCVTNMVSRDSVYLTLTRLHYKFSMLTNGAITLYLLLFGLRLSLNVVENVKGEVMTVVIMCFFITYVNNSMRMRDFIDFFVGLQAEFMAVSTAALYSTTPADELANAGSGQMNPTSTSQPNNYNRAKYLCYGPRDYDNKLQLFNIGSNQVPKRYTIWQRMDCLIAYLIGAHPVVVKAGQFFDDQVGKKASVQAITSGVTGAILNNNNAATSYQYTNSAASLPFGDMATDPYCYLRYRFTLPNVTDGSVSDGDIQAFLAGVEMTKDGCMKRFQGMSVDDFRKMARPLINDRQSAYLSFSLIVIIVGLVSSEPTLGIVLFITGFFVIILMMFAFAQAALVYITSLFAIVILGLLAPLILPCLLFKYTQKIFQTWVQLLFAYSIQPAILLTYMTFMIFVLQYMMGYKALNANGKSLSFVEMNLGEIYQKGYKGPEEAARIMAQTSGSISDLSGTDMLALGTQWEGNDYSGMEWSLVNRGSGAFGSAATEATGALRDRVLQSGFNISNAGASMQTIALPSFRFASLIGAVGTFGSNRHQMLISNVGNYDNLNANLPRSIEKSQRRMSGSGIGSIAGGSDIDDVLEKVVAAEKEMSSNEFRSNISFMQALIIIFLTLTITFAFMRNVMEFGEKLVGVGEGSISKSVNLYNIATNRLTKAVS